MIQILEPSAAHRMSLTTLLFLHRIGYHCQVWFQAIVSGREPNQQCKGTLVSVACKAERLIKYGGLGNKCCCSCDRRSFASFGAPNLLRNQPDRCAIAPVVDHLLKPEALVEYPDNDKSIGVAGGQLVVLLIPGCYHDTVSMTL